MKKLLIVINSLDIGGSEKSLISFLNLINYNKYQVNLLVLKKGGDFEGYIPSQVKVLGVPEYYSFLQTQQAPINKRIIYNMVRLKCSLDLRMNRLLNYRMHTQQVLYKNQKNVLDNLEEEYDIAVAYAQGFPTYLVADKVKANYKYAWINCDYKCTSYDKKMDEYFYNKIDKIIAVSEAAKNSIIGVNPKYVDKIEVIKDALDSNLILKMSQEYDVNFNSNILNIVTVARLVKDHKGYDIAIEAARCLLNKGIKFKWYAVGEGHDRKEIEKLIVDNNVQDNFILVGSKKNPYPYIKNADVYVQTSKFEGLGLTVMEAKILQKPIVLTNFSTAKELIKNKVNGLIVDLNGESVADAILKYINDDKMMTKIRKQLYVDNNNNNFEIEAEKINKLLDYGE